MHMHQLLRSVKIHFFIYAVAIDRFLQDRWKKNQHFTLNYVQLSHISNISQIKQTVLMNI